VRFAVMALPASQERLPQAGRFLALGAHHAPHEALSVVGARSAATALPASQERLPQAGRFLARVRIMLRMKRWR
jgi:hypothetical protein